MWPEEPFFEALAIVAANSMILLSVLHSINYPLLPGGRDITTGYDFLPHTLSLSISHF